MSIKSEACELYIQQEIDDGLGRGETPYQIGKRLAEAIQKLFEVRIKEKTIIQRARRQKMSTFVDNGLTPQDDKQSEQIQEIKIHGGKRKGAGRRPKFQPKPRTKPISKDEIVSAEFLKAHRLFVGAIMDTKNSGWETTSKVAALHFVDSLYDIIAL